MVIPFMVGCQSAAPTAEAPRPPTPVAPPPNVAPAPTAAVPPGATPPMPSYPPPKIPLTAEELDACTQLYVMTSACGFRNTQLGDHEEFLLDKRMMPVSASQARAECQAQEHSIGMADVGQPPVPVLRPAGIATLIVARRRGCAALMRAYDELELPFFSQRPW